MQGSTATLENSLPVSYKLNVYLLHGLAVPLLAVYPRKMNTQFCKTCTRIFTSVLILTTKNEKLCNCLSIEE